jgi:hypothetical protein
MNCKFCLVLFIFIIHLLHVMYDLKIIRGKETTLIKYLVCHNACICNSQVDRIYGYGSLNYSVIFHAFFLYISTLIMIRIGVFIHYFRLPLCLVAMKTR